MDSVRLVDLALELVPTSPASRAEVARRSVTGEEAAAALGVTGLVLERFVQAPSKTAAQIALLELIDPELVARKAAEVVHEYGPAGVSAEGAAAVVRAAALRLLHGEVKYPDDPLHALVNRIGVEPWPRS